MKQVQISTRAEWRRWLTENHDKEKEGIWLVFYRKANGRTSLRYEEALEEALCFGWIDSIIQNISTTRYCRKFTPRKDNSRWSELNKGRVEQLINTGAMTQFGIAKIEAAKRLGNWAIDPRPNIGLEIPQELADALAQNPRAGDFFQGLAPTYRKQFIGWIITAKRQETRTQRVRESLFLLERGEKLGLK